MKIIVNGHTYFPDKILKVGRIEESNTRYYFEFIMLVWDKTFTECPCSNSKDDLERLVNERELLIGLCKGGFMDFDCKHKRDN